MAIFVPDSCPSTATGGERRIFELLASRLSDRFLVWYEPSVQQRYPDFTLVGGAFGLLVLEVKGRYAGNITRADDHEVVVERVEHNAAQKEAHKHPLRQAREYLMAILDEVRRPEFSILRHTSGPR